MKKSSLLKQPIKKVLSEHMLHLKVRPIEIQKEEKLYRPQFPEFSQTEPDQTERRVVDDLINL